VHANCAVFVHPMIGTVVAGQGPAVVVEQDQDLRALGYESARSRLTPSDPYRQCLS